ncbi:DUF3408 domain-containing protein [Bacteroides pyogenes]|uniref:DUF3408 domain-containing protein n=1 Tax=Bacteroides pyogenes TaxID=310300 RepID=UPI002A82D346|nr:DUF3408 domain-containing protein [Bacteroides pyogenes]MDY4249534.1 DUF3408 domain-containing protein [Bacteroides pyogenes]
MAEKHKEKIDSDAIKELISQGIPMRRKESFPSVPFEEKKPIEETHEEERELSEEVRRPLSRTRRRIPKGDYESLFIYRNDLKDRKTIYVARELQEKLAEIVMSMKNREMTIGIYVENIILHHFEVYKDEINRLNELKFKKLL